MTVILSYDGKEIKNSAALPPMVGRTKVGEVVKLKVMRDGKAKIVKLKIGQLPDKDQIVASVPNKSEDDQSKDTVLGLSLRALTDDEMKTMELDNGGLLVLNVDSGSAKSAGVRQGDVIQMINGEPVETVNVFKEEVEKLPKGKFVSLLVQRSHGPEFIAMRIPEKE